MASTLSSYPTRFLSILNRLDTPFCKLIQKCALDTAFHLRKKFEQGANACKSATIKKGKSVCQKDFSGL